MAYYTVCPACGANLDPGEKCNCIDTRVERDEFFSKHIETEKASGQLVFIFKEEERKSHAGYKQEGSRGAVWQQYYRQHV